MRWMCHVSFALLDFDICSEAKDAHLLNSIKTVSIVLSRVQFARQGNFAGSTTPFLALTHGRFTSLMNWMVGGLSGYSSPQCIFREYIRFSWTL
jgi:hypothetical protein